MALSEHFVGFFIDDDRNTVPILGSENIPLLKESVWNTSDTGPSNKVIAVWNGDRPPEYNFNFTLFVGHPLIPSVEDLLNCAKYMNAWTSHKKGDGDIGKHPPAVTLIIDQVVNCKGVMRRCNSILQGPWIDSLPSSIKFEGQYLLLPGYEEKSQGVNLVVNAKKLSFEKILESFYVTD